MWGSNPGVKDTGKSTGGTKREVGKWDFEEGGSAKNRDFFATLHYILQWKKQKEGEGTKEVAICSSPFSHCRGIKFSFSSTTGAVGFFGTFEHLSCWYVQLEELPLDEGILRSEDNWNRPGVMLAGFWGTFECLSCWYRYVQLEELPLDEGILKSEHNWNKPGICSQMASTG